MLSLAHCGAGSGARSALKGDLSNGSRFSMRACLTGPGPKGGPVPEPRVGPEPYCGTTHRQGGLNPMWYHHSSEFTDPRAIIEACHYRERISRQLATPKVPIWVSETGPYFIQHHTSVYWPGCPCLGMLANELGVDVVSGCGKTPVPGQLCTTHAVHCALVGPHL